jgi:proteic killer suppression protein
MMIFRIELSDRAKKDLRVIPFYIVEKLNAWMEAVETGGIDKVRKIPGFHDEPLQGKRFGQRSVRLNRSYRAIYRALRDEFGKWIQVEEVNKHGY